jgi:hypothetical protein
MNTSTLGSLVRALLTLIGTFLIGKTIFGHPLLGPTWDTITGGMLTAGSIGWSIYNGTATEETLESLVRQLLQGAGGLLVGSGLLNSSELAAITSFVILSVPIVWGYLSKAKTAKIANGTLNAQSTGKVVKASPKVGIIILLICLGSVCHAQSITAPIAHPAGISISATPRAHAIMLGDTLTPGTNFKGVRLQGAGALYGVSFKPLSISTSAVAVVYGIGWENDVWDAAKQRFYQKFGVSLLGGPGGAVGTGIVGVAALTVSTQVIFNAELPFKLVVGVGYNTSTNKLMAVTGPINGLNN